MFYSLKWIWLSPELVPDWVSEIHKAKIHTVKPMLYLYGWNDHKPQLSFPTWQHICQVVKNVCMIMWTKECHMKLLKKPSVLGNKYVVGMEITFIVNETTIE